MLQEDPICEKSQGSSSILYTLGLYLYDNQNAKVSRAKRGKGEVGDDRYWDTDIKTYQEIEYRMRGWWELSAFCIPSSV